jgi:hypothetical protein
MKFPSLRKVNSKGFTHVELAIAVVIVAAIAAIGVKVIGGSHADAPTTVSSTTINCTEGGSVYTEGAIAYPGSESGSSNISFPRGFCMKSGNTYAIFQTDGNFVVYRNNVAIWQAGTYNKNASKITFQTDGNVVIYSSSNKALWQSGTYGQNARSYAMIVSISNPHGLYINMCNNSCTFLWRN